MNVGVVVADLCDVNRAGHRADFHQTDLAAGIDHAGIDRQSRRVNHPGVGRRLHVSADGSDLAISNHHRAALDDRPGDSDDAGVANDGGVAAGLRCRLRPEGQRAGDEKGHKKNSVSFHPRSP